MADLDFRGIVGWIYVGVHLTFLQSKYISSFYFDLFSGFASQSTALVISGRLFYLTTLFLDKLDKGVNTYFCVLLTPTILMNNRRRRMTVENSISMKVCDQTRIELITSGSAIRLTTVPIIYIRCGNHGFREVRLKFPIKVCMCY